VMSPQVILPHEVRRRNAQSRDVAGQAVGVAGSTVGKAVLVMKLDPEAFAQVQSGATTVEEAATESACSYAFPREGITGALSGQSFEEGDF
jgi:hypothetical protein